MLNTQKLIGIALMTAVTTAVSLLFVFPLPAANGIVTLAEAGIYIAAAMLGPVGGFWVGALSGLLIDVLSGYAKWAPFSFMIHALQGMIVGWMLTKYRHKANLPLALVVGSLVMIVGYFLATWLMYDKVSALISIWGNILQNGFGSFVSVPVILALKRVYQHHSLRG